MIMFKKAIGLFILIFSSELSLGQFQIKGQVTEEGKNEPMFGAFVFLDSTFIQGISDVKGNFVLSGIPPGTYLLKARHIGFEDSFLEIVVDENKTRNIVMKQAKYQTGSAMVVSTRTPDGVHLPGTKISSKDLEPRNLGQDLPMLLNFTPSVVVTSDAGNGVGYSGIRIRGSDPTRVNITINGIPVNDAESSQTYWVDFPDLVSSVEDIEIQRGVGSSTNGNAVFGANINLKTPGPSEKSYFESANSFGSFNTMKSTLKGGTGLLKNHFAFEGRISRITSDGYIDRAASNLNSGYFCGGYYGKKTVIKALGFLGKEKTYQAWYGVPGDSLESNRTFNPAGMHSEFGTGNLKFYDNETDNYRQDNYQLHFSHAFNRKRNINLAFHYTKGAGYYEQMKPNEKLEDYSIVPPVIGLIEVSHSDLIRQLWLQNDFYGSTFNYNFKTKRRFRGSLGGAYNIYEGDHFAEVVWARFAGNSDLPHRYTSDKALKTDFNWYEKLFFGPWKGFNAFWEFNTRSVDYNFEGFDQTGVKVNSDVNFKFYNPKTGISFDMTPTDQVYVRWGLTSREPNRDDLVNSTPSTRPKPEKLMDSEAGYTRKRKWYETAINFFYMDYTNQLVLTGQINNVGAYVRTNVPSSFRQGIELEGNFNIIKSLQWNLNATYSLNKIRNYTEWVDVYDSTFSWTGQQENYLGESDIAFSPSYVAGSSIQWNPFRQLSIGVFSKYVGQQFLDNSGSHESALDPFLTHDFLIRYTAKPKWMEEINLSLMIYNLLDEQFESNGWTYSYLYSGTRQRSNGFYPQAGRNFMAGLTLKF